MATTEVPNLAPVGFPDGGAQRAAHQVALTLGKAGTIPAATAHDQADFLAVVPFNLTAKRLKVSCLTKPSADTTFTIRRSTDSGASFSSVSGWTVTITASGSAKVFTSDPTDADWNEGDCLGFSVTSGGGSGTNVLIVVIGQGR